uniref:Uncharacterized protein n=1 Tax=Lepeophtheirus salmonis TaxID=72036 RepID=A0A0K2U4E2_LEPSM
MVIRNIPSDSLTFDSPTNQSSEKRGFLDSIRPSLPLLPLCLLHVLLHHSYS